MIAFAHTPPHAHRVITSHSSSLGVAFRHANLVVPRDRLVSTLTWGPFVHSELWLDRGDGSPCRGFSSFEGVSGFTPSPGKPKPGEAWTVLRYPLPPGGYEQTYAIMLQLIALNMPYNWRDLWQCCIKMALPFEKDLDCQRPEAWTQTGGVFCSQAALLVLRRLTRAGVLQLPPHQQSLVEATNSRGCSPNTLYRILAPPPPTKKNLIV